MHWNVFRATVYKNVVSLQAKEPFSAKGEKFMRVSFMVN